MRIYLDTADVDRIRSCSALGVVDGVTTNPSIVADSGLSYREAVSRIEAETDGPIFAQVIADDADGMVQEARAYQEWAEGVVAKIPASRAGFEALHRLREEDVPAGVTVLFSVEQAVLAAKADATFVAPYVGRLDDAGEDGVETVRRIQEIYDAHGFETEVLAASIRNTRQATDLYAAGVDAVTLDPAVLEAHVDRSETEEGIAGFAAAWGDRGSPLSE